MENLPDDCFELLAVDDAGSSPIPFSMLLKRLYGFRSRSRMNFSITLFAVLYEAFTVKLEVVLKVLFSYVVKVLYFSGCGDWYSRFAERQRGNSNIIKSNFCDFIISGSWFYSKYSIVLFVLKIGFPSR